MKLLRFNEYDIAVLDRDIPSPSGDEIARRIVSSGSGLPILMLTAADRLDDKATGFELGADDYLTKPFELRELVLRLRALDRRRAHSRPPVREIAGLRLDPFRREVYRNGRYVALTRKQFAVLEELLVPEPPDGVAWNLRHVGAVERGHHRKASGSLGLEHVHARVSEMHVHQPGALPAQHVLEVRLAPPTDTPLREAEDRLARSAHALIRVHRIERKHVEVLRRAR